MALPPQGHPTELDGPLVSLQSSNPSEVTHETQGVFSNSLVGGACMPVARWSQLP